MKRMILIGLAAAFAQAAQAQTPRIDAEIDALTARVEKLEGTRAVKKLQRAFGYYVDRGLWSEAADLFADDGTIEIGIDGVYVGKARIREYLQRLHGGQEGLIYGQLNEWVTLQPAVFIARDGRSATARWRDHGMLGQYKKHAEWRDGIYENTYVKRRRDLEDQVAASLREFRRALREGLGAAEAGRRAGAERGLEGVSTGPRPNGDLQAVSRNPGAAVPGAQSSHRQAGARSPLMRTNRTLPRLCCLAIAGLCVDCSRRRRRMAQATAEARLAAYRERVARLEDQDAVENLQATFGFYFDKGLWEDAADLFARNGSFEYGQSGVYVGQERIRRALLLFGPQGLAQGYLNNHMQLQPVITVAPDGRTATGRWQGMVMLAEPGANGIWGVGIYENEYVKEGGVWKIASAAFLSDRLHRLRPGLGAIAAADEGAQRAVPARQAADQGLSHDAGQLHSAVQLPASGDRRSR